MGAKTEIAWTDATWNPVSGCTRVSPGCDHCYARSLTQRLPAAHGCGDFSRVLTHPERLETPLRWRKGRRVFVCSMGDLFHPDVPFAFIAAVFGAMAACPQHIFQVLTKRPARALEFFGWLALEQIAMVHDAFGKLSTNDCGDIECDECGICESICDAEWPLPNVWLGVTAENQAMADERIPLLMDCPAAIRFVSIEPMLGPVDLVYTCFNGADSFGAMTGIGWVICGAESGPRRRRMNLDWARSLRDQCVAADVPFFLKQADNEDGRLTKMPALDGRVWAQMPEVRS